MKKYKVIETTDGQFLGLVYMWNNPLLDNVDFLIRDDITFHIQKTEKIGDKLYKHSNPHYIAIVEEID